MILSLGALGGCATTGSAGRQGSEAGAGPAISFTTGHLGVSSPVLTPQALRQRLGTIFLRRSGRAAMQDLVRAERRRAAGARTLLLLEAFWQRTTGLQRTELVFALSDVQRPARVPYLDRQVGLAPNPTPLYSTADPAALRRLAKLFLHSAAPSGSKDAEALGAALLAEARAYADGGQFLEAAGVLTLAQAVAALTGQTDTPALRAAMSAVANQRRCVARLVDAARPAKEQRLAALGPQGLHKGAVVRVAEVLTGEAEPQICAVRALQLLSSQPELAPDASRPAQVLLEPVLAPDQFAKVSLLEAKLAGPRPLWKGDVAAQRENISQGVQAYLMGRTGRTRPLLAYLDHEPRSLLVQARRGDVLLGVMFQAEPQPELGPRLAAAFAGRNPVVADPVRYIAYLGRLSEPAGKAPLISALRDPEQGVLGEAVTALAPLPPVMVEQVLRQAQQAELSREESQRFQERIAALRAIFRLPLKQLPATEQQRAWSLALDVHRCCRGDQGSCDRRSMPKIQQCPAWLPLRGW